MHRLRSLIVLCASCVCACSSGPDIGKKRSAWQETAPARYVVGLCHYGFAASACQLSAVENGAVVLAESKFYTDSPWEPVASAREPIELLFASAEDVDDDCDLSIDFDPTYSYPTETWFDCDEEGWGDRVQCFVPDSLDLEVCRAATVWTP